VRAILIDPVRRVVEPHTIDGRLASLQLAVGGRIAWGTELKNGDVLYVDDEGLLKPDPSFFAGQTRVRRPWPVGGAREPADHRRRFDGRKDR
jgi:hypothetical protein